MTTATAKRAKGRAKAAPPEPKFDNVGELLRSLGGVPADRVLWVPLPGTATEADLLHYLERESRHVELVNGTLVEKAMGFLEGRIGHFIAHWMEDFLEENDLGICIGDGSPMRILLGTVRLPDVSFVSWDRLPDRAAPTEPVPPIAPDLAVEVLSKGNTRAEMARKRREYFQAGGRVVWEINPKKQTAKIYTSINDFTELDIGGTLAADSVLPGFRVSMKKLFDRALKRGPRKS